MLIECLAENPIKNVKEENHILGIDTPVSIFLSQTVCL